jgi:hypothetical protein
MRRSIVVVARNEKEWPLKTCLDFLDNIPDAEIIGIDDGGENEWPDKGVNVYKTDGGIGVGKSRLMGVSKAKGDLIMLSDAHVYYYDGDVSKAWGLAEKGYIVNPSVKVMYKDKVSCGVVFQLGKYIITSIKANRGTYVGLNGSVYFMRKDVAQKIIAPTQAHGYNEAIMTLAAMALGYRIYALPSLIFEHMYKKKLDYKVTRIDQERNRQVLESFFFKYKLPYNATFEEKAYKKMIAENSVIDPIQLSKNIGKMRKTLLAK